MAFGLITGALISTAGSLIAGNKASSAAKTQANMQNEATQRQLEYDTEAWEMKKDQLLSQRDYLVQEIELKAEQEGKLAGFRDATNLRQYNYDLQIRNRQQTSNEQQFQRSNQIYADQLTLNEQAHVRGREQELAKLSEIEQEAAYDANEAYIDSLMKEGAIRARGVTGRTADKLAATTALDYGNKISMLNAQMLNASANTDFAIESIGRERTAADLRAYAAKMLDPGILPMPIEPLPTPQATFILPRVYEDYDFGPKPVLGAMMSPGAAASGVWGSTISSIAGSIGGAFNTYANIQYGQ
tara:strand:+ start:297 stop:1196 length:900 start_codon:yes stop_codon:yes gene_type:complete